MGPAVKLPRAVPAEPGTRLLRSRFPLAHATNLLRMSLSARMLAVAARSRQEAKELREAAQQEAAELLARAEKMASDLEEQAARLESQAGERMDSGTSSLTIAPNGDRFGATMQVQTVQAKRRGRPPRLDHPWPRWLAAQGSSVNEWSDKNGVPRNTAKGWHSTGKDARSIPRKWADKLEAESTDPATKRSALPANRRTWRNGITES